MKFTLVIIFALLNFPWLSAQEEWMNFTYGEFVTDLASDSNYLWIGTIGGLVKFDKQTEKMTFYNKANVLPDNHVRAVAIDSNHNIWIGTTKGLTRFDGEEWYTFNKENSGLPENSVLTIAVDSANTLFMGNGRWFTIFDGQVWNSIITGNPYIGANYINDIKLDSKGNAWIAASWGIGVFKNDSITVIGDSFNNVYCLAIDTLDNIWAGDLSLGLFKYDGSWTHLDTSNSGIPDNRLYDLAIDKEGNLWGAAYANLFKHEGENWVIYNSDNSILPIVSYFCLEFDNDNTLWLGTGSGHQGKGLFRYRGMEWKHYFTGNSEILNNLPYTVTADNRGNIWIDYLGRVTIQKYDGSSWQTYTVEDSNYFNAEFTPVCNEDSNKIWQGHDIILLFRGKNWAGVFSDKKSMISDYVQLDAKGNLWIVDANGIIEKYDGQQWHFLTPDSIGIAFSAAEKIAFDYDDNMYISTDIGLIKFDGTEWSLLPENVIGSVIYATFSFDPSGTLWIGTLGNGLIKYEDLQKTVYDESNSDLPDNTIQDLDFDQAGNLWIATQDYGLIKFDKNNTWEIFNRSNSGNSSDFLIMEMEIDINDNVWFLSEWDGLCVFREGGIIYPSSITYNHQNTPSDFQLFQNYPNPFNPETTISFSIPQNGQVSVKIYNITGRLIRTLADDYRTAGSHRLTWHGRNENNIDVASGMYICQVKYQNRVLNKKLLLIK